MNGIHDMGGMDGFGRVPHEETDDGAVFHRPWEGRVFALALMAPFGIRRLIEALPPEQYLASSYYERWLAAIENGLTASEAVTADELAASTAFFRDHPVAPLPRREDGAAAAQAVAELREHEPLHEEVGVRPRFAAGDAVRARNRHPVGHTRLPRYVRGRRGSIVRFHGVHAFPDADAGRDGAPTGPQAVYGVRFEARELWGADGHGRDAVHLDLWESYLEPA